MTRTGRDGGSAGRPPAAGARPSDSRRRVITAGVLPVILAAVAGCNATRVTPTVGLDSPGATATGSVLSADLDAIFDDPVLARALMAVDVVALDGSPVYQRDSNRLVVPASNMKLVTMAVAADRLGWNYRFETVLETTGTVADGVLRGDLIVRGGGDPTIAATATGPAPVLTAWADALRERGIHRVDGRLIGDDDVFEDEGRGAGWAWDYLTAGYAAPAGGLSYNENIVVVRIEPGARPGEPASVTATGGHPFTILADVTTGEPASAAEIAVTQDDLRQRLRVAGNLPAGGDPQIRTTAVPDPTAFFLRAFADVLARHDITVSGGLWDLDDVIDSIPPGARTEIVRRQSPPLSAVASRFLKDSQNFYGEMLLKSIGRAGGTGSTDAGRGVAGDTLNGWGVPSDAIVMYDGSGLSRYNYLTTDAIVRILTHVWQDNRLRGPFLALLPVAGVDGTLAGRMTADPLAGRVQAKTGTINNMRALSGYLHREDGQVLIFSMVANHFTAPSARIDDVVERALVRLARE